MAAYGRPGTRDVDQARYQIALDAAIALLQGAHPVPATASVTTALALYAISGRFHGDDDDSMLMFWAATKEDAIESFRRCLLDTKGLETEDPENDEKIYINAADAITTPIARSENPLVLSALAPELVAALVSSFEALDSEKEAVESTPSPS